jgi:hypothetical protein
LVFANSPKNTPLSYKQREEEDLLFNPLPTRTNPSSPFFRLNLQAAQALKGKSNPK